MPTPRSGAAIVAEVARIGALSLSDLRVEWRQRWGEPPAFSSRELLARAFAHKLQTEALGDLDPPIARRLADLAERFMRDRAFTPATTTALHPGSSLIREWKGQRHEVAVVAEGFAYAGKTFRSLSKVAEHITGTKWSGPAFFGLKRS